MARPRLSPEAKAAKKNRDAVSNAQSMAADALLCFPADMEKQREEFVDLVDQLTSAAKAAAADAGAHKKRLVELYKVEPWVIGALKAIRKLGPGKRERAIRQFVYLVKRFQYDAQLDLFNADAAPGGAEPDQGSVFDSTGSGDKVSAERLDDPGRARKSVGGPPKAPAIPTPNVGVEGLAAGIKQKEEPEEKRARIEAEKQADAAAFEGESEAVKNMTPAQKRAEAAKIAREVEAKQAKRGLGPDAIH